MKIELPCGKESVALDLPDTVQLLQTHGATPVKNTQQAVEQALAEPTGTPPLAELAQGR
jgi:hypothetical protein